jgi:hypothetical protein
MKRTLLAAIAVLLSFGPWGPSASAGGYESDFYAGTDIYVARANVPVYDCGRWACQTNIRLRAGSSVYAICWDGGEGWCKVQTRYFKNIFLPRYALDLAYGGHRYRSYYFNEAYPRRGGNYDDCYYKDRYYRRGRYAEGCYEKYSGPYSDRGYRYGTAATEYGYERSYRERGYKREEYAPNDYNGDGYRDD